MKKYTSILKKSDIFKNLSYLVIGTILAQVLVVVFQIVLRRLFSPQDFGAFAVYMSLLGILATISSFRYEQTIILPKLENDAKSLLGLSLFFIIIFSIVLEIIIALFHSRIAMMISFPKGYIKWLYLLPISILFFSLYQALNFYLIRIKSFKVSGINKIIRRFFEGIVQSFFGIKTISKGLIFGDLIGQFSIVFFSILKLKKHLKPKELFNRNEIIKVARRYKEFPIKNSVPALLNALSLLLPIIIINRKFAEEITGYFDLARMVLIIPLSLVTTSLSQVLLQKFTEKRNEKQSIKKDAYGVFISLFIFSTLFVLILELFGIQIFEFVFGKKWSESGTYAQILVYAFAIKFIVSPFNILFTVFEKIGIGSIWQTIYFLLIISLFTFPVSDIYIFLKRYLLIEIISYLIAAFLDFTILVRYEKSLGR